MSEHMDASRRCPVCGRAFPMFDSALLPGCPIADLDPATGLCPECASGRTERIMVRREDGTGRRYPRDRDFGRGTYRLVTRGGSFYHTHPDCYLHWNRSTLRHFRGWVMVPAERVCGMRKCPVCESRDAVANCVADRGGERIGRVPVVTFAMTVAIDNVNVGEAVSATGDSEGREAIRIGSELLTRRCDDLGGFVGDWPHVMMVVRRVTEDSDGRRRDIYRNMIF